ncbi:MAG: GldG family protein, partial [Nitrospiraceae bacterium]
PQTVQVVRQLGSTVHIRVFGQESSPSFNRAKKLLESYRYVSRNVMYSIVDLDRAPLLAKEFGIDQYDSIVVESSGNHVVVYGISEESITNGIIKATREIRKKIYFLTGHGENDIQDNGRNGMSRAVSRLSALGYELTTLVLGRGEAVPDDADLLVIAGPKERFSDQDLIKINKFITQDGKILGLFDPGFDPSPIIGGTGIQMLKGQITDPSSNLGGRDVMVPLVSSYPDTPITRNFTLSSVFPGVAPLETGAFPDVYEYFTIASTSPESTVIDEGIAVSGKGEHIIAAAAGSVSGKDIMVVFGDADFVTNAFFDVVGNGNFFLNSVNWILEEGDLISIIPQRDDFIPLYITPQQARVLFYISVIALPLSVFALGFNVWRKRKVL